MKKTSNKASKRRLKKSIRRTFGGIFLASAILVAAIPFPEAKAYDPATVSIPDYPEAVYDTDGTLKDGLVDQYVYKYADMEYPSNTDFTNMGKGKVHKALIMSRTSVGSWQMDWQYEYWIEYDGSNGYITNYNSQYSVEDIKLESRVYSDFVFITQEDMETFYNSTDKNVIMTIHHGDNTPTEADKKTVNSLRYSFIMDGEFKADNPEHVWLSTNFNDEVTKYREDYSAYYNHIDPVTNNPDPDYPKPDPVSKTLADLYPTDDERIQYLCKEIFGDGMPTSKLVTVDKRKYNDDGSVQWEKVLVPNIGMRPEVGTISLGGHSYYVDMDYFLCDTFATITGIGKDAFKNVSNVKTMEMAKEISFIGDSAFEDSFLSTVALSSDAKIGNRAFYNCTKLSSVDMPEGIRRIGAEAFYGCPLKEVIIPDSCVYVGPGAFAKSGSLSNVVFNDGSTNSKTIGDFAFYNDLALNNVSFGESYITKIGDAAFAVNKTETGNMTEFTFPSYIEVSGGRTSIGEYCLAGRDNLDYVTFPDNLSGNLNDNIFYLCLGLECVTFGEKCYNMSYESSVDGDDNSTNTLFYSVANKNFYVKGPKSNAAGKPASPRTSTWTALYDFAATGDVGRHVPYVYVENGKEFYEVSDGNYLMVIDKETGELVSCTFPYDKPAKDIEIFTIPAVVGNTYVTGIKDGCFNTESVDGNVLDHIINLVIEDGSRIENLGDNLFKNADKLETVYIGDSVQYIGSGAFEDCPNLNEVTISKNIVEIGDNVFQKCPNLEDITFETPSDYSSFPEGSIGENAFNTGGVKLTIHGDIVEGYAPFEWATDKNNYANKTNSIRTLYKSPLPSDLSVILDNQNELVTLVDYPHYEYLNRIAYDSLKDKLVELEVAPQTGDPYYGKTIKDKIDNDEALNYLEETMILNCLNLEIPSGVESIDSKGFFNDSSKNPDGVTSYSNRASAMAYFNTSLTPYNTYASEGLFNGYYGNETGTEGAREYPGVSKLEIKDIGNDRLKSVIMHDVKYLPDHAFESCENLETAYVGGDISDIGSIPFVGCKNLSSVAFENDDFECINGIIYKDNNNGTKSIVEGLASRGLIVGGPTLDVTNDPEFANVSKIEDGAFTDCDGIASVNFAKMPSLEVIPKECFMDCDNLSEVDVPLNVTDIGDRAFAGAGDYIKVTVRNKALYLGVDSNGEPGDKIKNAFYVTYKDAQSRRTAKNQGYIIEPTLDDKWTVTYYDREGKNILGTELVDDGMDAEGLKADKIPTIDGYKFVGWTPSLENITEDCKRYAVYEKDDSTGPNLTPTPGVTPAPTQPVITAFPTQVPNVSVTPNPNDPSVTPVTTPTVTPGPGDSDGWDNWQEDDDSDDSDNQDDKNNTKKYKLNVVYGSGTGEYPANTTIIIEAINPPAGKVFDKWVVSGTTPTIFSATSKATTIKMPAGDCTITATYKDSDGNPAKQSVNIGNSYGRIDGVPNNKRQGTVVDINKPGISNVDKAYASVSGSTDNFIVKILDNTDASNMVATVLAQKYADMSPIKYYAYELALYDANGVNKIAGYDGLAVTITIPIPDALVAYAGNNRVAAVDGSTLVDIPCKFVTVDGVPCVSFTATKFSIPYTIYADTSNLTYGTIDSTPKTGDGIHPKWFVSIALFCCSMILFLKKDKTHRRIKTA